MAALLFKSRRRGVVAALGRVSEHPTGRFVADPPGRTAPPPGPATTEARGCRRDAGGPARPADRAPSGRAAGPLDRRFRLASPATAWTGPGAARGARSVCQPPGSGKAGADPGARDGVAGRFASGLRSLVLALFFASLLCLLAGCASTVPEDALRLSPETLELRQLQTRRFDGTSENEILAAAAGVLQDLGFVLDESETALGLIVASKRRTARDARQIAAAAVLELLLGWDLATDEQQMIRASLVTRPASAPAADGGFLVRITFQRLVRDEDERVSRRERLEEPELYQGFFERLSTSVFLEAQEI
jgi:hypothetical protein